MVVNTTQKNKAGKMGVCVCVVSVLNRMVGEGFTEKITCGPRAEGGEQNKHPGRGNHKCKGPGAGTFEDMWIHLKNLWEPCGRKRMNEGMLLVPYQIPWHPFCQLNMPISQLLSVLL